MRRIALVILALLPTGAHAGLPFEATLEEMATSADHILAGLVTGVDMVDGAGRQVQDREARTGPGLRNQIRLRVSVDEILFSYSRVVPKVLFVPLASHLHYTLGQVRDAHTGTSESHLIFLKGRRFEAIRPGVFMRPL